MRTPSARPLVLALSTLVACQVWLADPGPSAASAAVEARSGVGPVGVGIEVRVGLGEPRGVWPLDPRPEVVRGFEPPAGPYSPGHRGVDLLGTPGQAVRSALSGTVAFAGSVAGKPVVTVSHGARRTTYEPVAATVVVGEEVGPGDVLGRLVVTDGHCFPAACLHWGLVEGEGDDRTYLDPLTLVGGGPVRLLPLWRETPSSVRLPWTPPLRSWRRPLDCLV